MIYQPVFFGVCEWLGRRTDIRPPIIRVVFIIFTLAGGAGILLYFILLLVKLIVEG